MNNHIFKNPYEIIELLKQDWQIEIKTMSEHFSHAKIMKKMIDYWPLIKEIPLIPSREPPGRWSSLNNLSKIANY
jgi:hypothetical protein